MPQYSETRFLPYTPRQLFDLVADIETYPEFLPWCVAARIRERTGDEVLADLVVGNRIFRERFTSKVTLDAGDGSHENPPRIDVEYVAGPMQHMENHWVFRPADGGTELDFHVDFEFRSRILQAAITSLFNEVTRRMVGAFGERAGALYGGGAGRA
jgi:coenzyme Q-binding protein COQ10